MTSPDTLQPPPPDDIEQFMLEQMARWRQKLKPGPSANDPVVIATSQRLTANLARTLRGEAADIPAPAPDEIVEQRHRVDALLDEGDLSAARHLQEDLASAAERTLGFTHPETLRLKTDLALTLYAMAEFELAKQLQIEIVHDLMSVREDETHTDVLEGLSNLARTLLQIKGEEHNAYPLSRHVFASRLDALGASHPDTVAARNALNNARPYRRPEVRDFEEPPLPLLGWIPFRPPGGDHHH